MGKNVRIEYYTDGSTVAAKVFKTDPLVTWYTGTSYMYPPSRIFVKKQAVVDAAWMIASNRRDAQGNRKYHYRTVKVSLHEHEARFARRMKKVLAARGMTK